MIDIFNLMSKSGIKSIYSDELIKKFPTNKEVEKLDGYIKSKGHEKLLFSCFPENGLKSIIAVHSTVLGPAVGGTRLWNYNSFSEALKDVLGLSRAMTYKTAGSDLNFGGGKAIIWVDPKNKSPELLKNYANELKKLKGIFYTGEDANINMKDIAILAKALPSSIIGKPKMKGIKTAGDPAPPTAEGVLEGIKACLNFIGEKSIKGKTIAIHGIGNVGFGLLKLVAKENPSKIFISDFNKKALSEAKNKFRAIIVPPNKTLGLKCDIYSPCLTLGGVINKKTISGLKCKIIAGSTNNQLAEPKKDADLIFAKGIIYAPDYIINAGGVINVVAELDPEGYSRQKVKEAVDKIYSRIFRILYLSKQLNKNTRLIADTLTEVNLEIAKYAPQK